VIATLQLRLMGNSKQTSLESWTDNWQTVYFAVKTLTGGGDYVKVGFCPYPIWPGG